MFDLGLYVHLPWCLKKCPYCDFNSYPAGEEFSRLEPAYVDALIADFQRDCLSVPKQELKSIYFGGGTPTLFSARSFERLLAAFNHQMHFSQDIEISLEANPGSISLEKACALRNIGANRLSLGVQSFKNDKLRAIGRIHDREIALAAIENIKKAGFENFNIDLMFGLPGQSIGDAHDDLKTALSLQPTHISYYQLSIEPDSDFFACPPVLPGEDQVWEIQQSGLDLLSAAGFKRYEISAFSRPGCECRHNLNYWLFGDYLGIGAGAHGKITEPKCENFKIQAHRYSKIRIPSNYLAAKGSYCDEKHIILPNELTLEFMLNTMRLYRPISKKLFEQRTGIDYSSIEDALSLARAKGMIDYNDKHIYLSELGRNFLNDLLVLFT